MTTYSLTHNATTATLFVGYIGSIGRDPRGWSWPDSTLAYLQQRVADLAADLLLTGATLAEVA